MVVDVVSMLDMIMNVILLMMFFGLFIVAKNINLDSNYV